MGKLRTTDGFKGLSTHLQAPTTLRVKRRHRRSSHRCSRYVDFCRDLQEIPINFLSVRPWQLLDFSRRWTFPMRIPILILESQRRNQWSQCFRRYNYVIASREQLCEKKRKEKEKGHPQILLLLEKGVVWWSSTSSSVRFIIGTLMNMKDH